METQTLRGRLAEMLQEAILGGKLEPGARLNESRLARELNVSRIPVREALQKLEEQGLVVNIPRRGNFVVSLSEEEVQKINSLRLILESEALVLCKARMQPADQETFATLVYRWENSISSMSPNEGAELDLQIHRTMWSASDNEYLAKILTGLTVPLFAYRVIRKLNVERKKWGINSHIPFLEFVQGKTNLPAEQVVLTHLKFGWDHPERFSRVGLPAS